MFAARRTALGLMSAFVLAAVLAGPADALCGPPYLPAQAWGFNPELGSYISFDSHPSSYPDATLYSAGGKVQLGLTAEGNVGIRPDNSWLGLAMFREGQWEESLAQYCRCEGWGIADTLSGVTGWASWDNGGVSHNLNVTDSYSSPTTGLTSQIDIDDHEGGSPVFRVNQYAYGLLDSNLLGGMFQIEITVQNATNDDQNVVYRRVMDWDVPEPTYEYVSAHDGPVGSSGWLSPAVTITNDGFASANPLVQPVPHQGLITGPFDDNAGYGRLDDGASFDFQLGHLGPHASMSFSVFYGAAFDKASAILDLKRVGVTAYSVATGSTRINEPDINSTTFSFGFGNYHNRLDASSWASTGKSQGGHVNVWYIPSSLVKIGTNPAYYEGAARSAAEQIRNRADAAFQHYHDELGWNPPDTVDITLLGTADMCFRIPLADIPIHCKDEGTIGWTPTPAEIFLKVDGAGYERYFYDWASHWDPGDPATKTDLSWNANGWSSTIDHECWHIVQNQGSEWGWPRTALDSNFGDAGKLIESSAVAAQDTFTDWQNLSYATAGSGSYQEHTLNLLRDYAGDKRHLDKESELVGGGDQYRDGAILRYIAQRLSSNSGVDDRGLLQLLERINRAGGPLQASTPIGRISIATYHSDVMQLLTDFYMTSLISRYEQGGMYHMWDPAQDGMRSISWKSSDEFFANPGPQDRTIAYAQSEVFLYRVPANLQASWAQVTISSKDTCSYGQYTAPCGTPAHVDIAPVTWARGTSITGVDGAVEASMISTRDLLAGASEVVRFSNSSNPDNTVAVVLTAGTDDASYGGNYTINVTFGTTPLPGPHPQVVSAANSPSGGSPVVDVAISPLGDAGAPLDINVTPSDDEGPIANATVEAVVTDPSGKVRHFAIPDAGLGDDPFARDGIYASDVWGTSIPGTYGISVTASGVGHDGSPFTLTSSRTIDLAPGVDTDGDGITDQAEVLIGLDPNNPSDAQIDLDQDGLTWAQELAAGTDWLSVDTDGGGEPDGSEVARGLDPLSPTDDAQVGAISLAAAAQDGRTVALMFITSSSSGSVQINRIGPDGQTTAVRTLPAGEQSLTDGPLPAGEYTYQAVLTLPSGARSVAVTSKPVVAGDDVTAPVFDFMLNGNRNETTSSTVDVWVLETSETPTEMRVAETEAGLDAAPWVPYTMHSTFELTPALGDHAVFVELRDAAGNVSAPMSQMVTKVVGSAPPSSSAADPLSQYVSDPVVSVAFDAMFPNGPGSVELWERFTPVSGSPGAWFLAATATATESPFSVSLASGPGRYEFYTIAIDAKGLREAPPAEADTVVILGDTGPTSSIDPIPPKTGGDGIYLNITSADVWGTITQFEIWERHSSSPGTYSDWTKIGTTTGPHFAAAAALANGPGDYEFYSIASDNLGGREVPPATADARTTLDPSSLPSSTVNALPPLVSNSILSVAVSTTDEGAGVGGLLLESRCLPEGGTTWSLWVSNGGGTGAASPVDARLDCGDGTYEFYSVALDWTGNLEAVRAFADATTVLDSIQPVSSVGSLPASVSSPPLSVPFTASDTAGTGIASVELWQRFKPAGGNAGAWVQVVSGRVSPFSVHLASGAGTYYFYTIAVDAAGNREPVPTRLGLGGMEVAPDASVVLNTSALSSAVGFLPAGVTTTTLPVPFTAAASANGPGLASVELWERFKATGPIDWTSWTQVQSGLTSPFSVSLDQGQGRYEFYTIAVDAAGNHEAKLANADAFTVLETDAPLTSVDPLPATTTGGSITLPYSVGPGSPASVEIWRRFKPLRSATWGPWGWVTMVTSSPVDVSLPSGKGTYEFYSIGISAAGVREAVPANADASVVREPTDPGSTAGSLPEATQQSSIPVPYWAEFPSGQGSVELWESYAPPGSSTFGPPSKVATVADPAPLTAPMLLGDGTYQFYTIAVDGQSSAREAVPASAEATTVLDTVAPTSTLASPGVTNWASDWVEVMSTENGSGVARVDLYYRLAGESSWHLIDSTSSSDTVVCSSQLTNCDFYPNLTDGDGAYEFTAVVTDKAGNVESGPGEAKTSLTLDTVAPTVTVTPLAPGVRWGSVSIAYSASDTGTGVAYVDVYRRSLPVGSSTWGDWTYTYVSGTSSPISAYWSGDDGRYEFYLVPCDTAGNCRAAPDASTPGDTFTILDSVAPVSSAGSLTSPTTASSVDVPYTASDAGGSGVAKVELYRRFTAPGGTPSPYYTKIATITSSAESGTFTAVALANDGTYDFYTRATDLAGGVEAAPSSPESTTVRSTAPASSVSSSVALFQKASPLSVPWVVTSSGSGIASVELWRRYTAPGGTPSGSFTKAATYTGSATSGTFSLTASSDGTYELYTIAVASNGSREPAPAGADASVVLDKVAPTSSASATSPTTGASVDVAYTAADNANGSGLTSVELYQRFTVPGGTPSGAYTKIATITSSAASGTFAGVALAADGRYEFYTRASDAAANQEAAPSAADASVIRDTAAPSSSAAAPATTAAMSVNVTYTINDGGGSGPASIELWQRYTVLGGTPSGSYSKMATITGTAASGTFSNVATAADGSYEFYTIALDAAGNREAAPASADATTVRDTRIPATNAGPLAPAVNLTTLPVPYTVTAGTVSSVVLYQRWTTPGGTPSGSYSLVPGSPSNGVFTVTLNKGAGRYEFYTLGTSPGGVTEGAPPLSSPDAFTILDTIAPTSSASALTTPRNTNAISVIYSASDNTNGTGVASVDLYERFQAAGATTWSSWAPVTTATSSPISVTLSAGDGRYEFYTRAADAAGNREAAPSAADAFTVLDTTGPVTSASALAGGVKTTSLSVAYTASDAGSSVASVELYQRYTAPGATPSGAYTKIATATASPIAVTLGSGAGRYEFYTLGVDALGNREAVPASPDTFTILDTTAPTSAAGAIPGAITSPTLSVPYTASDNTNGSGLSKVDLYQRFQAAGSSTWSSYSIVATATATSGNFNITLGSGSGTYQFYTIATDAAGNTEAAPASADASTVLTLPDTTAPTSTITAPPSTSSAASVSIAYTASDNTGGSGLATVEFWYRFKASDGATPGAWTASGTSTAASGSFTLTFGSGAGIYDVLTVAVDVAGNREGAIANPPAAGATPKSYLRSISWAAGAKVNTDTGSALQDNAAYAVGSDGTVYAVWEDSRNGATNTDIYFSSRNPSTGVWAAETKLNADTGTTGQRTPSIAIDGSGNLYVVWADDRNGSTNTDIYFAKRTGSTWSANIKVNADTGNAVQSSPRISVSSAGIAVAVWYDARSSQVNIYSARLPAGSTTWSANYKVTSNTSAVKAAPDVAVASDGTAWATWQDNQTGGGDIYVASLGPTATAWSTNTKVSDDSGASALDKSPRIGLTSANLPVVAYLDGRTTNAAVRVVNRTSGGTWNASVQVSDSGAKPATGLALAVKTDGGIIVAWDDTRGTSAIYGAQCEAGSGTSSVIRCGPVEKWSDQSGASSHPTIVASTTQVYLGWSDATAGNGDIRIRLRSPS
jgi:hypothetical protein